MRKMELIDITLRDAQQCLWATRMTTAEVTPIARTMDDAGFSMIDLTGGAAIDSGIMYLGAAMAYPFSLPFCTMFASPAKRPEICSPASRHNGRRSPMAG
jgi:hypothetical protein